MRRVACVILLAALPAAAKEVWRDDRGAILEASGFYKTFLSSVWLQPGLVDGTKALQALLDEVRPSVPAGLLPADVALPSHALLNAHIFRASATLRFEDRLTLDVAWQLTATLASSPKFTAGSSLSGTIGGSSGVQSAQRRLVELASVLSDEPGLRVEHNLDRLALKLALPFGDLTIGRQVLSWGTGRVWNPTDVLSPFPPTVIDREVRRGFDAVRLAVALGSTTQLDLLYLPQQKPEDNGGVARLQGNVKGWDGSVSVGKYVHDVVIGADLVGDVGPLGVHAEGAYTLGFDGFGTSKLTLGEHFFRGVAGVDWRPHDKWILMAEYHFNGFGADEAADYAAKLSSARVVRGEIFGAGKHYAAISASFLATDLLTASATVLANLADPSALIVPAVEWSFEQTVLLRFGGYVPIGAAPDATVFSSLTRNDALTLSPAFGSAQRSLGIKSEYGAATWGAFVQVGLYVP